MIIRDQDRFDAIGRRYTQDFDDPPQYAGLDFVRLEQHEAFVAVAGDKAVGLFFRPGRFRCLQECAVVKQVARPARQKQRIPFVLRQLIECRESEYDGR